MSVATLERWPADALSSPTRERMWTAATRLQAVIATAAIDEAQRNAWCRESGVYPTQLQQLQDSAAAALSEVAIKPIAKGGTDELSNLQRLQWATNRSKGDAYPWSGRAAA